MADKQTIAELSSQLITAVEQLRACDRQIQLCKNQQSKAEIVVKEVDNSCAKGTKMYRSIGRLFIVSKAEDLTADLNNDLQRIAGELSRSEEMKKNFEIKKETLTN